MKFGRMRFLLTLVVAMFLANNVAVAARAFTTGLSGQDSVAVQALDAAGIEHLKAVDYDVASCLAHCAQSHRNHEQQLATNTFEVTFLPALAAPCFSVDIKPAASVIALAPRAAGPPLTLLFRNLRN